MTRQRMTMLAALILVAAACSSGTEATAVGSGDNSGTEVVLTVYVGDEIAAEWTLAELRSQVEFITLEIDGDEQNGPRLLDVLAASGVTSWETAEVLGKGEGRSYDVGITISSAEVDDGWVLDVTNRGTLKLAAAALPRDQWVRDAGEIRLP